MRCQSLKIMPILFLNQLDGARRRFPCTLTCIYSIKPTETLAPPNQKNDRISGMKIHEETFHKLFFHQGNPQLHFMQFRASTRLTSIFRLTFSRKRDASNSGLKFSNVHLMSVGAEIRDSLQYPGKPRAKLMYCSTLYRTTVLEIQVSQPGHQSETLSLFKE